ncbi:MAG: hypothetical protein AB7U18_26555, partial [Dehalococcoidia bacterium]
MYGENGQLVDVAAVGEAIDRSDVLTIGFHSFPERLIVDSRRSEAVGPMVRVVEPVGGVEERMFWLGRNRPQFGLPEQFTFFVWPHSIDLFESLGLNSTLLAHVGDDGMAQTAGAFVVLRGLVRASRRSAFVGDQWRTLG